MRGATIFDRLHPTTTTTATVDEKMLAWRALMELHASVVDALGRHLQAGGAVALDWYEVLLRLSLQPDASMRMQDLAGVLLLSPCGGDGGLRRRKPA